MGYDFAMEMKLMAEAPQLHQIFSDNVMCCQKLLNKYQSVFPEYTDHTALHSLEVIAFCNELIGDNIEKLNTDEVFILLMGAYLHDSGMGISEKDYEEFMPTIPGCREFVANNPDVPIKEVIRMFHNDFSGCFIYKYAKVFDFPTEEHLFGTIQASVGHRKTNLFNNKEYPVDMRLDNGHVLRIAYISALIRMADELDIAIDRNIQFLYDESNIITEQAAIEFAKHKAIRKVAFGEDSLDITIDYSDEKLKGPLDELVEKLNDTLTACIKVIENRTPFVVKHKTIRVKYLKNENKSN